MSTEIIIRKCPMCGNEYTDEPAISRAKDHKEICTECGVKQAMFSFRVSTEPQYQTRGVAEWIKQNSKALKFVRNSLNRHIHHDWGEMDKDDLKTNDMAVCNGDRIFSSYKIPSEIGGAMDDKIWIITEWDLSATTVLFPSEY